MEIYLLREEKELGPYSNEDICTWLDQGDVSATELAWSPGLETWQPLNTLLDLPAEESEAFAPAPVEAPGAAVLPQAAPVALKPARVVQATPRQKAFLSYMGVFFSPALSEEEAESLIQEAHKDPKLAARQTRWEDERLELHPELFTAEIRARKENRPAYFHKLVQTEGGDCFSGVTKAHCQVIVTFLDSNYPRWDARLGDAAWRYFFPAVNEKFPQLVRKEWRPKLKFPDAPRVAEEMEQIEKEKRAHRPFSIRPYVKALATLVVLGGVATGAYLFSHPEKIPPTAKAQVENLGLRLQALIRGDEQPTLAAQKVAAKLAATKTSAAARSTAAASGGGAADLAENIPGLPADDAPKADAPATDSMAAATPMAMEGAEPMASPDMAAMSPTMESAAPAAQPKPTEALFDPKANNTPPALPAAAATERKDATLVQPVSIQMAYGLVTINAGTSLKVVARAGDRVQLNYMNKVISVPVASTNLTTAP